MDVTNKKVCLVRHTETQPHRQRHTDTTTQRHTDTQTRRHKDTQTHTDTTNHRFWEPLLGNTQNTRDNKNTKETKDVTRKTKNGKLKNKKNKKLNKLGTQTIGGTFFEQVVEVVLLRRLVRADVADDTHVVDDQHAEIDVLVDVFLGLVGVDVVDLSP